MIVGVAVTGKVSGGNLGCDREREPYLPVGQKTRGNEELTSPVQIRSRRQPART